MSALTRIDPESESVTTGLGISSFSSVPTNEGIVGREVSIFQSLQAVDSLQANDQLEFRVPPLPTGSGMCYVPSESYAKIDFKVKKGATADMNDLQKVRNRITPNPMWPSIGLFKRCQVQYNGVNVNASVQDNLPQCELITALTSRTRSDLDQSADGDGSALDSLIPYGARAVSAIIDNFNGANAAAADTGSANGSDTFLKFRNDSLLSAGLLPAPPGSTQAGGPAGKTGLMIGQRLIFQVTGVAIAAGGVNQAARQAVLDAINSAYASTVFEVASVACCDASANPTAAATAGSAATGGGFVAVRLRGVGLVGDGAVRAASRGIFGTPLDLRAQAATANAADHPIGIGAGALGAAGTPLVIGNWARCVAEVVLLPDSHTGSMMNTQPGSTLPIGCNAGALRRRKFLEGSAGTNSATAAAATADPLALANIELNGTGSTNDDDFETYSVKYRFTAVGAFSQCEHSHRERSAAYVSRPEPRRPRTTEPEPQVCQSRDAHDKGYAGAVGCSCRRAAARGWRHDQDPAHCDQAFSYDVYRWPQQLHTAERAGLERATVEAVCVHVHGCSHERQRARRRKHL